MTQSQSICTRIQRRFANLFNPAFDNTFKRELFKKGGHELWVLQSWALTHDEYELQWICNCPNDSWKNGQTWTKKQGRHRAFGDAMFFLESVRRDGPMMTERWVCPGWSCMPRRFVVFIAALTLFFALYRFPRGSLCCLRHGRFSLHCIVVEHESFYESPYIFIYIYDTPQCWAAHWL